MPAHSKVFFPSKILGRVSNHIPVVTRYIERRKENLLVTSVGKAFHTYGVSHFTLLSISGLHEKDITCIAADRYLVFTAAGNIIYAWRRGYEKQHKYEGHDSTVHLMLTFGPHLISVDENSTLKVWDIKAEKLHLDLEFNNNTFQISTLMHPATYLNKILLGSEQGSLQLWNLLTSKLIYTFKGWDSGVSVVEQSPAVDIVGIGLKNGNIFLHNLKYDETVMKFQQDWGMVTALSFRTDETPIMISGTVSGYVVMWHLEEKRVFSQIIAHHGMVTGLQCLTNEPLMVTSSPDNSLKLWIFDLPDGGARLLRIREGHSLPPSYIRFHGANGQNILSSGGDSTLRIFNTVTETFNKSLGRASYDRKKSKKKGIILDDPLIMPPIMKFTSETTREKEWDNIAALHMGCPVVTTWSYDKLKMGDLKLLPDRMQKKTKDHKLRIKSSPVCICLTHCGNFVVVGYTSGHCDKFNIQSGLYRGGYGTPTAHEGAVRGVITDTLSQFVVTGGNDKLIKWWNFKAALNTAPVTIINLQEAVSFFTQPTESALVAIALEDFTIVIIDLDCKNIIRKFVGHSGRLTDACFSNDSRLLITSAMDCCVFTWDVPAGCLVDVLKFDTACTSLSFSPTSELLATTHVDELGVYLWSNRSLFSHVSLKPIKIINTEEFPISSFDHLQEAMPEVNVEDIDDKYKSPEQIEDLVTFSTLASSRWLNLLNIDVIRQRNKPKEPPKAPKAAPFFLPTVPAINIQFDLSNYKNTEEKIILPVGFQNLTVFGKLLQDTLTTNDFMKCFEKLKSFGPTTIDFEITSLTAVESDSVTLLLQFMRMIKHVLDKKTDFELAEAYLALFLKVHGQFITQHKELVDTLLEVQKQHNDVWKELQSQFFYNLCTVEALKNL